MTTRSSVSRRRFFAGAAALAGGAAVAEAPDAPFRMLSPPVLTNPAPDSVTVMWATSGSATGWVEYGETEQLGQRASGSERGMLPFDEGAFKVRISGLNPGTRYHYRVHAQPLEYTWQEGFHTPAGQTAAVSDIHSFTTPNPAAAETRFTVWNDTHEYPDTLRQVHDAHVQAPGDFLLWNGDVTNDVFTEQKMVGQFLAPANLPFAARVPYYLVRGNHDVRGPAARRLHRFTDVPEGRHYYMFRHGPLAAVVLDTGEDKVDGNLHTMLSDFAAFRAAQAEWLATVIERPEFHDAPYRVVFCHIPLWWRNERETGTYCLDGRKKWHDLLVKGRVQIVISGHTHDALWMPANQHHPYGQLIGGGPRPNFASYLRGHANDKRLLLTQYRLNGKVWHEVEIKA